MAAPKRPTLSFAACPRPSLSLTKCAGAGCDEMCNLKEDGDEPGKFYCVNCLWKKGCAKSKNSTPLATTTPRKLNKKEQKDRQSRSKLQRGRRDGKMSRNSGKMGVMHAYEAETSITAIDKGDPNYCSDEDEGMDYGDDAMDDSSDYRYEVEDGQPHTQSVANQDEGNWPTITRRVSFNDDVGKALTFIIPEPEPPATDMMTEIVDDKMPCQLAMQADCGTPRLGEAQSPGVVLATGPVGMEEVLFLPGPCTRVRPVLPL